MCVCDYIYTYYIYIYTHNHTHTNHFLSDKQKDASADKAPAILGRQLGFPKVPGSKTDSGEAQPGPFCLARHPQHFTGRRHIHTVWVPQMDHRKNTRDGKKLIEMAKKQTKSKKV